MAAETPEERAERAAEEARRKAETEEEDRRKLRYIEELAAKRDGHEINKNPEP